MTKPFVELQHVSFSYESNPVLDYVSLRVDEGDFLAVIGPNGSGKSTLLKILLGLLKAKGDIKLFGEPVATFQHREWIGYVSQKSNAFNSGFPATVKEVVQSGLAKKAGLLKRMPKNAKQRVREALAAVGMEQFLHRKIGELSGGQQQRVFIARALIAEPKLLVLDEPTVGVDIKNVQSFYEMLGELNKKHHLTIILVTHDLEALTNHVSHVAFLNKRLLFYGDIEAFRQLPKEQIYQWYGHAVQSM